MDTPRKVLCRRLGVGQDWFMEHGAHLCTPVGSFRSSVCDLSPMCFRKGFGET